MRVLSTAGLALVILTSATTAQVVTNTYDNLDPRRALTDAPVTLSRIGAAGDFVEGVTPSIDGKKLAAQVDVMRKAPTARSATRW